MNARNKLNTIFVGGSVVLASGLGIIAQSWTIFGLSLGLLLAVNLVARSIRPR